MSYQDGYKLAGKVYFRESTNEWVLHLYGEINGCHFDCKHAQPASTKPEDVAGLGSLYQDLEATQTQLATFKILARQRKRRK